MCIQCFSETGLETLCFLCFWSVTKLLQSWGGIKKTGILSVPRFLAHLVDMDLFLSSSLDIRRCRGLRCRCARFVKNDIACKLGFGGLRIKVSFGVAPGGGRPSQLHPTFADHPLHVRAA